MTTVWQKKIVVVFFPNQLTNNSSPYFSLSFSLNNMHHPTSLKRFKTTDKIVLVLKERVNLTQSSNFSTPSLLLSCFLPSWMQMKQSSNPREFCHLLSLRKRLLQPAFQQEFEIFVRPELPKRTAKIRELSII